MSLTCRILMPCPPRRWDQLTRWAWIRRDRRRRHLDPRLPPHQAAHTLLTVPNPVLNALNLNQISDKEVSQINSKMPVSSLTSPVIHLLADRWTVLAIRRMGTIRMATLLTHPTAPRFQSLHRIPMPCHIIQFHSDLALIRSQHQSDNTTTLPTQPQLLHRRSRCLLMEWAQHP